MTTSIPRNLKWKYCTTKYAARRKATGLIKSNCKIQSVVRTEATVRITICSRRKILQNGWFYDALTGSRNWILVKISKVTLINGLKIKYIQAGQVPGPGSGPDSRYYTIFCIIYKDFMGSKCIRLRIANEQKSHISHIFINNLRFEATLK